MAADSAAGGGGRWNGGVGCFGGFGCACRSVVAVVIVEPKRRGVSARFRTKPKSERGTRPKKSVAKPKKSVTRQQKLVTRRSKLCYQTRSFVVNAGKAGAGIVLDLDRLERQLPCHFRTFYTSPVLSF